jgi:polysaccharide export outer membrane protein
MIRRLAFLAAIVIPAACSGASPSRPLSIAMAPEVFRSAQRFQQVYVVGPGDQLDVSVANVPEVSRTSTVRPDGFISLPKVGDVHVAGLSVPEAREVIRARFAERLVDPDVSLNVANPRDATAFVLGEVGRPNAVPIRQAQTVAEAIALVGGPTRAARVNRVALVRLDGQGHMVATMLDDAGLGSTGAYMRMQATPLQAGDIIIVPESGRSKFARFIQDFVSTPLSGFNALLGPYVQLRLLQQL